LGNKLASSNFLLLFAVQNYSLGSQIYANLTVSHLTSEPSRVGH